jgi:hypothetical protein
LNNLEFPWPKDNLYHVWLKLVCWFWRRFLKKKFQCIFTLSQIQGVPKSKWTAYFSSL